MPQFLATYFNLQPQFAPASWREEVRAITVGSDRRRASFFGEIHVWSKC